MHLTQNGVTIEMDDSEVVRMALERLAGSSYPATLRGISIPRIGEIWAGQGGVYAGIGRGVDGGPDFHLIVGQETDEAKSWTDGMSLAKSVEADFHSDFSLPTRKEQALCFANVPELFKPENYWSCERHVSDSAYAWYQNFANGGQYYNFTSARLRVRFVRRLPIQ